MNFHILTLFPDMVMQGLSTSIIGRAKDRGLLSIEAVNIRDYTLERHKKVDDYPYGGGAGMLMQAQPVYDAWKSVVDRIGYKPRTVYLTPQGPTFTQPMAKDLAQEKDLILLCGHYEGIDERVLEEIVTDYVSIGEVPPILLSGDHKKVDEWRREQAILRTIERRPDLLKKAELTKKEQMKYQEYLL